MNTFHPGNRNSWHVVRQEAQGPIISPVFLDNEEGWQCYCKYDGISGEGKTLTEAYKNWQSKVRSVEKYLGY
jgi:hypothetical protein